MPVCGRRTPGGKPLPGKGVVKWQGGWFPLPIGVQKWRGKSSGDRAAWGKKWRDGGNPEKGLKNPLTCGGKCCGCKKTKHRRADKKKPTDQKKSQIICVKGKQGHDQKKT